MYGIECTKAQTISSFVLPVFNAPITWAFTCTSAPPSVASNTTVNNSLSFSHNPVLVLKSPNPKAVQNIGIASANSPASHVARSLFSIP